MKMQVVVVGVGGKMGREVVRAVLAADDMELVGAVDPHAAGVDVGDLIDAEQCHITVDDNVAETLQRTQPDAIVDFTQPTSVYVNVATAIEHGVHAVVGTTGLSEQQWNDLHEKAEHHNVGVIHAPNFAIGAVLMMRFAQEAAQFFAKAEIIEMHHDQKHDAPSGTALHTAELMKKTRQAAPTKTVDEIEVIEGARGGDADGIHIHSVRLPGLVAHQEVIFGLPGETLTIRHDSLDRSCFMPGVLTALRRVSELRGVTIGLENVLFS